MEDQYGMADLRQLLNGGMSHFPPNISQQIEIFPGYRNIPRPLGQQNHHNQYNLMMFPGSQVSDMMLEFMSDSAASSGRVGGAAAATTASASYGGDGGSGRWPRQETLTLLEIRSRLDSKFKEANQKGPLWDEVSRIMSEEYGFQRSGKKCREKFENLYKYYKKRKEGKSGRQDGKHYRFFRQLEALYGETNNGVSTIQANQQSTIQFTKHSESLCLSNSSEFDTYSSDGDCDVGVSAGIGNEGWERRKKRRGKKYWKAKIKTFINSQMRKLIEKQEEWLEKLMKSIEEKEKERMIKEEEYRKSQVLRIDREHRFWAKERAWIEARDAAFMESLQKLTGGEVIRSSSHGENQNEDGSEILNNTLRGDDTWRKCEITRLIQLRSGEESQFEEIGAKMACLGHERSGSNCKEKWEIINKNMQKESKNKKRKEKSKEFDYIHDQGGEGETARGQTDENGLMFLLGEGESSWQNYGMKSNKPDQSYELLN